MKLTLSEFDFELPSELIAGEPLADRSGSRMMTLDRRSGTFDDRTFRELPEILSPGDLIVLNNTKVFPARLIGRTETGASVEIFLIEDAGNALWNALAKPAKRLAAGKRIHFDGGHTATVVERTADGGVVLEFNVEGDLESVIDAIGRTPLPPYIKRDAAAVDLDTERYQTVYASERGAIAAPTAGLHFTPKMFDLLASCGIDRAEITLHVGYGTFEPIRTDNLAEHRVKPERYSINDDSAEALNRARSEGRRIIAVGTTTTRCLESNLASGNGRFTAFAGWADLTILPGYQFGAVNGLLTNFHLPKSSLLVLVSTFAGHDLIMDAYRSAVASRYRFYSYGDCMLVL